MFRLNLIGDTFCLRCPTISQLERLAVNFHFAKSRFRFSLRMESARVVNAVQSLADVAEMPVNLSLSHFHPVDFATQSQSTCSPPSKRFAGHRIPGTCPRRLQQPPADFYQVLPFFFQSSFFPGFGTDFVPDSFAA
jgi:hypothetical protein